MNENNNLSCALPGIYDNWNTIPWKKVIHEVTRQQRRIAKAYSRVILRRKAFKEPEPYAGKLACTVLRGRKLPGAANTHKVNYMR